ncbi:decreased expression in renal and prostate cancer protein-like [Ostrea edulis]|uniref:decreased expression in renal and prostate cancer protein-like n=1 Tax=Ostrea edulis TaxID=37623 RepID=UPI002095E12E|nr:decreased expression in renal and prostate cancer protein-like [Ostrea edulis]XP_056005066.1 decreased expression in renal and prostate cancer protein-like [Ostrea edulis]
MTNMRFFVLLVLAASVYGNPPQVINIGTRFIPRFHNQYSDLVARMLQARGMNVYSVYDSRIRTSPSVISGGFGDLEVSGFRTGLDRTFVRSSSIARGPSITYRELFRDGGLDRPSATPVGPAFSARGPGLDGPGGIGPDALGFDGDGEFGPDAPRFNGPATLGLSTSIRSALPSQGVVGPEYDGPARLGPGFDGANGFRPRSREPGLPPSGIGPDALGFDGDDGFGPDAPGFNGLRLPGLDRTLKFGPGLGRSVVSGPGLGVSDAVRFDDNDGLSTLSGRADFGDDLFTSSSDTFGSRLDGRRSALSIYDVDYAGQEGYSPPYLGTSSSSSRIYNGLSDLYSVGITAPRRSSVSFRSGSFPSLRSSSTYFSRGPSITYGPRLTSRRIVTYPGSIRYRSSYPAYANTLQRSGGLLGDFSSAITSGARSTGRAFGNSLESLTRDYSNYLKSV